MCCGKLTKQEMQRPSGVWWRRVEAEGIVRVFSSQEAAEAFLSRDINFLGTNEVPIYVQLAWQRDMAENA